MIDLTPIAEPIQKRLFEKMKLLGREGNSPNTPVSVGGLTYNQLAVRSPFIRMVSGLQDPVILMGGELTYGTTNFGGFGEPGSERLAEGYGEMYGSRVIREPKDYDFFDQANPDENKFKRPIPGIKSITAQFKGGIRALREGTISWTCWSFEDINRLMPHFLAVGPSVMLEWGWVYGNNSLSQLPTFFSGATKKIKRSAYNNYKNTIIEANGDFDMMIGIIKNFEWTTRDDGGFDCTTTITSAGVNTLGTIQPPSNKPATTLKLSASDSVKEQKAKLEAGQEDPSKLISLNWSVSVKTFIKNIDIFLQHRAVLNSKDVETEPVDFSHEGGNWWEWIKKATEAIFKGEEKYKYEPNKYIYKGVGNKVEDAWVRWGWFEDNILSKFTTVVGDGGIRSEFRSVEKPIDESGKEGPFYESVRIRNHPKLKTTNLSKYILPGQFFIQKSKEYGNVKLDGDDVELDELQTIVNDVDNFNVFTTGDDTITTITESFFKDTVHAGDGTAEFGGGSITTKEITAGEYTKGKAIAKRSGGTGKLLRKTVTKHQKTVVGPYGYLRNMLINTKVIKEAFGVSDDDSFNQSTTISDALRTMFRLLNEDINVWKFQISGDTTNPKRNKIVDTQITVPLPPKNIKVNDSFAKLAGTRSTYQNGEVSAGVFFFPVWRHDSLVKSQTLNASIPNSLAISAMYGNSYDTIKSGGDTPTEVSSEEAYVLGKEGQDIKNPSVEEKNIDIALNSDIWSKIGTPPDIDSYVPLAPGVSDVDIRDWLMKRPHLITQNAGSRIAGLDKNIAAAAEADRESKTADILSDSTAIVFLDDLIKMTTTNEDGETIYVGEEAFTTIKMYKEKMLGTTHQTENAFSNMTKPEGSKFFDLYSSIFERATKDDKKVWKMKKPWINAVRFDIMNNTTKVAKISVQEQPLLLPLTLTLSIDGIGGIFPGNSFHSTYVPKRYQEDAIFQVFDVNHSVDSTGWSVEVGGMMRSTMERVQHIEWSEKPKKVIDALERFKTSKNRWDTQQIKDSIEAKIDKMVSQSSIKDRKKQLEILKTNTGGVTLTRSERAYYKANG